MSEEKSIIKNKGNNGSNNLSFADRLFKREVSQIKKLLHHYLKAKIKYLDDAYQKSPFAEYCSLEFLQKSPIWIAFLEWVVFNYQPEGEQSIFHNMLANKLDTLAAPLVQELQKWPTTYYSVYQIKEQLPASFYLLQDIFTKKEFKVCFSDLETLPLNNLVVCRLLPLSGSYHIFMYLDILSAASKDFFCSDLSLIRYYSGDKEDNQLAWPEFLQKQPHIVLEILLLNEQRQKQPLKQQKLYYLAAKKLLHAPQEILWGKTPTQAVIEPAMHQKLQRFLELTAQGYFDRQPKGVYCYSQNISLIKEMLGWNSPTKLNSATLNWEKNCYQQEADLMLQKMAGRFLPLEIKLALYFWNQVSLDLKPLIKKNGSWAGTIDYLFTTKTTQKEISAIYNISTQTIARNNQMLVYKLKKSTETQNSYQPLKYWLSNFPTTFSRFNLNYLNISNEENCIDNLHYFRENSQQLSQKLINSALIKTNKQEAILLAEKALSHDRECVKAYLLLADLKAKSLTQALTYYQRGYQAAYNQLGPEFFEKNAGVLGEKKQANLFLKTKFLLAKTLWKLNYHNQAFNHLWNFLDLDQKDHLGVRFLLSTYLLSKQHYQQFKNLLTQFPQEKNGPWLYNQAFYYYQINCNKNQAQKILKQALAENPFVAELLLNRCDFPQDYSQPIKAQSLAEAALYVQEALILWEQAPAAMSWLKSFATLKIQQPPKEI